MKKSDAQSLKNWLGAAARPSDQNTATEPFPVGVKTPFPIPEHCGHFDMRIDRNGTWFYQGSPIGRKSLCKLFASVLHRDDHGRYWLITPAERGQIEVECAPFIIIDGEQRDKEWQFTSNLDHCVTLDEQHQLVIHSDENGNPVPLLRVRDRLDGLVSRALFYRLVESAQHDANGTLFLQSGSYRAVLGQGS